MQYKILTGIMSGGAPALKVLSVAWKYRVPIAKVVGVGTVLVAAYSAVYGRGYHKAEVKYLHQIELTDIANRAAIEDANTFARKLIEQNTITNDANEVITDALHQAAAVAPRNAPVAIHAGSLRKLAAIH